MVSTPHPSRARTVITPSGGIVRGKFPSKKVARMIHHEGLLELEACYLFEMSPHVTSYREQPFRLQYADDARLRSYTPDFELTLDTGDTVLVEIKPAAILARPENRQKYDQIASHMQRNGQRFSILTDEFIRSEPRLSNLRRAYRDLAAHKPSRARLNSILSHLTARQNLCIHEVNVKLKPYDVCAFDLLAGGYLGCDLTRPLTSSTQVSLHHGGDHDWVRISEAL